MHRHHHNVGFLDDLLAFVEQEVLWRADWVLFCLAWCVYSAPHPSLTTGHHCLSVWHIYCGYQCAKVSMCMLLKVHQELVKMTVYHPHIHDDASVITLFFSQETCDDNLNITMCPLCDGVCDYWRLSTVCSLARASYLFDNGATVLFAIFMSLWGKWGILMHSDK